MDLLSLFLIAVGLSMDAFAVSVCKGLATPKYKLKYSMICGAWFGGFQALMPAVGYLLGVNFKKYITAIDHWIAFVLLALIGFNMIREALKNDDEGADPSFTAKSMSLLAVATSIDALAIGITLHSLMLISLLPYFSSESVHLLSQPHALRSALLSKPDSSPRRRSQAVRYLSFSV